MANDNVKQFIINIPHSIVGRYMAFLLHRLITSKTRNREFVAEVSAGLFVVLMQADAVPLWIDDNNPAIGSGDWPVFYSLGDGFQRSHCNARIMGRYESGLKPELLF
jgi:hypothetical protein